MKTKAAIFYLASILLLFNSCDSKMNMDTERDSIKQEISVGSEHNKFLENVISSIRKRGITTRGMDADATAFTNHMTDVGVQETLDYALDQDILRVKDEASNNTSLVTILAQVYGSDFTEVLRGYTSELQLQQELQVPLTELLH